MSIPPSNTPQSPHPDQPAFPTSHPEDPGKVDDLNLGVLLANLWEGRYLILGAIVVFMLIGSLYAFTAAKVYQVEALLQTETQKTYGNQPTDFTKMEGLYSLPTVAQGEIEIIKSNLILGRVVMNLNLDVQAAPHKRSIFYRLFAGKTGQPKIDVEAFIVPDAVRGTPFTVIAQAGGGYVLQAPDGATLAQGLPGERVNANYHGNPIQLKIRSLRGKPGQRYTLALNPMFDAITDLRLSLQVEERGKNAYTSSNILWLSLNSGDPDRGAQILNELLNQYIRQTVERKAGESAKGLALLENQRPILQSQLAEAESRLNEYRRANGVVDSAKEGELYLMTGSALGTQISALQQRREELLRTYTEQSDVVVTLDQQIAQLRRESGNVNNKVAALPRTQQEVVRLSRDVQVKSELYTSLLSSIQQLQNTLAGSVGNARVVDYAIPSYDAIAPKKKVLMILFLFLGSVVGTGLTILQRLFRRGIEDHRIIESKLGLPILVTIPHSEAQRTHNRAKHKHGLGQHLLALHDPEDMAAESIRSLRTVLHFTMEKAQNRIVLVTGPSPEIGKSFVSSNLAVVLARAGGKVLLVDSDMRKGNLHRAFGLNRRAGGLAEVLAGRADWKASVKSTEIPGLGLLTTGILPADPLILLMSSNFDQFTSEVSQAYDFVIFDAPPLLPVTDALIIGSKADTILMVAKYGAHPLDELRTCMNRMRGLGDRLKGCVFNDIKLIGVGNLYGYYKYEFDYKYKREEG